MITPNLFARGSGGAPSTAQQLADMRHGMRRYQHTIAAVGGFESCTIELDVRPEEAIYWLDQLGASIIVAGPEGQIIWEGMLVGVGARIEQESIDRSLDDMANAVRVRYQPDIGPQTATAFGTDTTSISAYGRKELIYSGSGMSTAGATALRDALLAERKNPLATRSSEVRTGQATGETTVTLRGVGWYFTLGWLTTSSSTTSTTSTTGYTVTLLTNYNSTNNYFSTSTSNVTASGLSETQYIDDDTTYRAAIERLLGLGNSSGQRQAWGIYTGRAMTIKAWAGASPTTIGYQRELGDHLLYDNSWCVVQPWDVRPDAMYQVRNFVDPLAASGTQDGLARYYVERVTCSVDRSGAAVRLEPARSTGVDVLLARLR